MKQYQLILTEEQARLVANCCEFYSRIKLGQFNEISYQLTMADLSEGWCERRDEAERYLQKAKECIYPELKGVGRSYGIGKFDDADKAYDVFQVIRKQFQPDRGPIFSYQEEIPEFNPLEE